MTKAQEAFELLQAAFADGSSEVDWFIQPEESDEYSIIAKTYGVSDIPYIYSKRICLGWDKSKIMLLSAAPSLAREVIRLTELLDNVTPLDNVD